MRFRAVSRLHAPLQLFQRYSPPVVRCCRERPKRGQSGHQEPIRPQNRFKLPFDLVSVLA